MPSDLATTDDVIALFRPLVDGNETTLASVLIRMASARLRAKVANLDHRLLAGSLDARTVSDVVASMVVRVLRNPEGVMQETVGSLSASVSAQVAPGYLTITPDELEMLLPAKAVRASVGTINLVPGLERRVRHRRRPL